MSPLRRALTLTTLALGLALGASSAALADTSFEHNTSFANAQGAKLTVLRSHVGDDGKVTYKYVTYTANAHGASVDSVTSAAK